MSEYEFVLALRGDADADGRLDALFEAGCDDAAFGSVDGAWYGDFTREALSFQEAVRTAIAQINSVEGLKVLRIEPDDLVSAAEIASRLGVSRQNVAQLISGERGHERLPFPLPASHLTTRTRLWRWSEVVAWYGKADADEVERARWIALENRRLEQAATRVPLMVERHNVIVLPTMLSKASVASVKWMRESIAIMEIARTAEAANQSFAEGEETSGLFDSVIKKAIEGDMRQGGDVSYLKQTA